MGIRLASMRTDTASHASNVNLRSDDSTRHELFESDGCVPWPGRGVSFDCLSYWIRGVDEVVAWPRFACPRK